MNKLGRFIGTKNKNTPFSQEYAWEILRKHSKWDAPAPAPVDLTEDEEIPAVNTDELFGPNARPRPPGKQCPRKKTKSDTSVSTGRSSSKEQFFDFITNELRLKREAIEAAFGVAKEKDRTVMRLEEMKVLAISTKDLLEDDAYFIEEQKKAICSGTPEVTPEKKLYAYYMSPCTKRGDHIDEFNKLILDLANNDIEIEDEDHTLILLTSFASSYEKFMETLLYGKESLTIEDVLTTLNSIELKKRTEVTKKETRDGLYVRGREALGGSRE
nr:retrovirus-related Pol polyprotein from transposon TNT 1-94 [Tanacetum cinerariifolium]